MSPVTRYGPHSHEVQDVLARADEDIGRLLDVLDHEVGAGNYVVALSGDHGVARIPEDALADGQPGGRLGSLSAMAEPLLVKILGPGKKVGLSDGPQLSLTKEAMAALRANPAAEDQLVSVLKTSPGASKVLRPAELASTAPTDDPDLRAWRLSNFPGRSGDFVVVAEAGLLLRGDRDRAWHAERLRPTRAAGHLRSECASGQYLGAATPADIAPTFAFLTNISLPSAQGRVLKEALTR